MLNLESPGETAALSRLLMLSSVDAVALPGLSPLGLVLKLPPPASEPLLLGLPVVAAETPGNGGSGGTLLSLGVTPLLPGSPVSALLLPVSDAPPLPLVSGTTAAAAAAACPQGVPPLPLVMVLPTDGEA